MNGNFAWPIWPICCVTRNTQIDTGFAARIYKLLQRAVGIGRRRAELKDTTLVQYRADLDRRLDRLLAATPNTEAGRKLAQAVRKCRGDLFLFVTRCVMCPPPTTTASGRCGPASSSAKSPAAFVSEWGTKHLCRRRLGHRHRQAARSFSSLGPPSCHRRLLAALMMIARRSCAQRLDRPPDPCPSRLPGVAAGHEVG